MIDIAAIKNKFALLAPTLSEAQRRLLAVAEAQSLGHGGIKAVAEALGMSRRTIERGAKAAPPPTGRSRISGGGRKRLTDKDAGLKAALDKLVDPTTRGDPMSPLRWTTKSTAKLAEELTKSGHPVGARTVAKLLIAQDYSLQSLRKRLEGASHPDRDAQFKNITKAVQSFQKAKQPTISVDTKKKELIGEFSNKGAEWQPKGKPEGANTHDFPDEELGKAIPYGVYDMSRNEGWVSVGVDHDTAEFATETIRRWWEEMGRPNYPHAKRLLITADCGGSNSSRTRLWKKALSKLAQATGLVIHVKHFPPGTSKWNKIEHRMFSQITANWRGRKLTSRGVVVELIGATKTKTGLNIKSQLDENNYPTKQRVSEEELQKIKLKKAVWHGDWNYKISP